MMLKNILTMLIITVVLFSTSGMIRGEEYNQQDIAHMASISIDSSKYPCTDRDTNVLPRIYCYVGKIKEPIENPNANNHPPKYPPVNTPTKPTTPKPTAPIPIPTINPNPPTTPNPPSTGTELRFITVGDPQGESAKTKQVVDFINSADVDFAAFLGDYVNTATVDAIKNNMQKSYFVVEGNHDLGKFNSYWGYGAAQYYSNVNGFQIVIPAYDWSSYNWNKVDATKPTIVFNHGPVLPNCGAKDSLHKYAFNMKPQLDKLNMLAFYDGHTHTYLKTVLNGRLYVAEDSLSSQDRGDCYDGASKYVGYTRIKADGTVEYARLDFSKPFVNPFT